jgi:hypothetical protein
MEVLLEKECAHEEALQWLTQLTLSSKPSFQHGPGDTENNQ